MKSVRYELDHRHCILLFLLLFADFPDEISCFVCSYRIQLLDGLSVYCLVVGVVVGLVVEENC